MEFREQNLPFEATLSNITSFFFRPHGKSWKDVNIFTLHSLYINTETTITVRDISKKLETKALVSLLKKSQKQNQKKKKQELKCYKETFCLFDFEKNKKTERKERRGEKERESEVRAQDSWMGASPRSKSPGNQPLSPL